MARLPVPGDDHGNWGDLLNEYLQHEHGDNGALKIRTDGTLDKFVTHETAQKTFEANIARAGAKPGDVVVLGSDGKSLVLQSAATTTQTALATRALTSGGAGTTAIRVQTTADGTKKLFQGYSPAFGTATYNSSVDIKVDPATTYQSIIGFGAALTDSAASMLMKLTSEARTDILTQMFSPTQNNWSTLRICIGASDFISTSSPWTYDDIASGTDVDLLQFNLGQDYVNVIPVLQEIMAINPDINIFASIWRVPAWMMSTSGDPGYPYAMKNSYFPTLANYFVKFIQAYQALGIPIFAVSAQNEPTVSNVWRFTTDEEANFIGYYLGPALENAGLSTRITALDDNWSQTAYAASVLGNTTYPNALTYIDGVAWHGYSGRPNLPMTATAMAPWLPDGTGTHPVNYYFTELRSLQNNAITPNETPQADRLIIAGDCAIGAMSYWSKSITLWNLALDQNGNPTNGSVNRQGVITINSTAPYAISLTPDYYILTHLAKYVQFSAQRIYATPHGIGQFTTQIESVAFKNPDGTIVLFVYNPDSSPSGTSLAKTFNIIDASSSQGFAVTLQPGDINTFIWGPTQQTFSTGSVPSTPTLTATAGTNKVTLSWTAPSSSPALTGYQLTRSTASGAEATVTSLLPTATSYSDWALPAGTQYYYKLLALNDIGYSAESAQVTATTTGTALAAPTINATSSASTSGSTHVSSLTWTHTGASASNRLLVVAVQATASSGGTSSVTSVTYGGVALTRLTKASTTTSLQRLVELWYLVAPAAGANSIVVTMNIATSVAANATSFRNVNQLNPFGAPANYASASTTLLEASVSTVATDVVFSAACVRQTTPPTAGTGQTVQWSIQPSTNTFGAGSTESGTGSLVVSSYTTSTADHGVMSMVPIHGN